MAVLGLLACAWVSVGLHWRKLDPPQSTAVNYPSSSARTGPHGFLPYPCCHVDLLDFLDLVCVTTAPVSVWIEHITLRRQNFTALFPILWPLNSLCSLFHSIPWALGYVWYRCPINSCVRHQHLSTALGPVVSLNTNHYSLQIILWSWRSGSVVKSAYCSCRGPEFSSHHPFWGPALTHTNLHT